MEGLTKENFFNEVAEKYPLANKLFCDWIDAQKLQLNWKQLFNEGAKTHNFWGSSLDGVVFAPKFHDIPFELQYGILIKFIDIKLCGDPLIIRFNIQNIKDFLIEIFAHMQKTLEEKSDAKNS